MYTHGYTYICVYSSPCTGQKALLHWIAIIWRHFYILLPLKEKLQFPRTGVFASILSFQLSQPLYGPTSLASALLWCTVRWLAPECQRSSMKLPSSWSLAADIGFGICEAMLSCSWQQKQALSGVNCEMMLCRSQASRCPFEARY